MRWVCSKAKFHLKLRQVEMEYPKKEKSNAQPVTCETCGISMTSEVTAQSHFAGKAHAKMLRKLQLQNEGQANQSQEVNNGTQDTTVLTSSKKKEKGSAVYCEVCEVTMSSEIVAKQHYAGKAHNKKLQKRKYSETETESQCSMCGVLFNSEEQATLHYAGKKHAKKLKAAQNQGSNNVQLQQQPPNKMQKVSY